MKTLLGYLVGVAATLFILTTGLALSGHLVLVGEPSMVNVVDDNGKVLFQMQGSTTFYRVTFVK